MLNSKIPLGIGTVFVDINRFKNKSLKNNSSFYKKIFSNSEIKYCQKFRSPYEHFAGKFAIKESVIKAIPEKISFIDISTTHYKSKPKIMLKNELKDKYDIGIHIDLMDGHFVPNLSFGADIIKGIRGFSNLPFDVHLMIENPEHYVDAYVEAGANFITVHPEATPHIHSVLQKIHKAGVKTGIALNPGTPIEALENVIDIIDLILVMTVNPGFGGQSFLSSQLPKVSKIRTIIDDGGHSIDLSVDGGINPITAKLAIDAGANILVAGTSIFKAGDETYSKSIKRLRNLNP